MLSAKYLSGMDDAMKEYPIIFSGPMVRAILGGRKTQTRRIIKSKNNGKIIGYGGPALAMETLGLDNDGCEHVQTVCCPYGQPGDSLWVREKWRLYDSYSECACYDECRCARYHNKPVYYADTYDDEAKWRPSIHMPRWASRITLEITGVRVERLHDISEEEAILEGVEMFEDEPPVYRDYRDQGIVHSAVESFGTLWDSINWRKEGCSWEDHNPWVWVIEFFRRDPEIKRVEAAA